MSLHRLTYAVAAPAAASDPRDEIGVSAAAQTMPMGSNLARARQYLGSANLSCNTPLAALLCPFSVSRERAPDRCRTCS